MMTICTCACMHVCNESERTWKRNAKNIERNKLVFWILVSLKCERKGTSKIERHRCIGLHRTRTTSDCVYNEKKKTNECTVNGVDRMHAEARAVSFVLPPDGARLAASNLHSICIFLAFYTIRIVVGQKRSQTNAKHRWLQHTQHRTSNCANNAEKLIETPAARHSEFPERRKWEKQQIIILLVPMQTTTTVGEGMWSVSCTNA